MSEAPEPVVDDAQSAAVRPWWVLVAVCSSILVIGLNTTAMNTAIGSIAEEFDLGTTAVAWAVNGYLLAAAAFVAPGGQFGDIFARKRMYGIGLAVFATGSVVIATAPDVGLLIGGRALQGAGSAFLLPAQLAIVRLVFPEDQQGTATGIWAATASLTFAIGPLYGGLFADTVGWRWMFWFDLVLLAICTVLALRFVRPVREDVSGGRPDLVGAALLAFAAVLVVLSVQQGGDWGWTSPAILAAAGVALVLLVAFWRVEHRAPQPLVHFPLFRIRSYTGGVVTTFAQGVALMGFLYFVSIHVESYAVYDYSPLGAGLVLLPGGVAMFAGALAGGRFADRVGYRLPNTGALAIAGVGAVVLATVGAGTSTTTVAALATVTGLGVGIAFSTTSASGMTAVPSEVAGEAGGVINMARYVGAVLVVALGTMLSTQVATDDLNATLDAAGISASEDLDLDRAMGESADELEQAIAATTSSQRATVRTAVEEASVRGFRAVQLAIAAFLLGVAVASWLLFRPSPGPRSGP